MINKLDKMMTEV